MDKLTREQFIQIKNWMYRNARPLEIARWKYHFEKGSREDVITALKAYQNDDGGFGNSVEPDSWNPNSSPYSTSTAIGILDEINFNDKNHPIIKDILNYLDSTADFTGKYWPALIQSNNDYPHAPWWTFTDDIEASWGYTPTAKLAGFILRFAHKDTNIYEKAKKIASEAINKYLYGVTSDGKPYRALGREGEVDCLYHLLMYLEEVKIWDLGNTYELKKALKKQVDMFITRDPAQWKQYCCKPSMFITSPESIFFEGNEEIMNHELSFILNNRNKEGVWNIVWSWESYEKEFAISENWWKANIVIWNMLLLKNFNCLL
ncbi:hypothetical protein ACTQ4P_15290 [Clostridium sporogenes]|uniref:hypothetical protein n=1 Tax=Clostridium sporogenes TaxID=1509 RepID=UPI0029026231|nr:hypothetical protein [Clostridium botulinum]